MSLELNAVLLGVKDLAAAKKFYGEGLGCKLEKDFPVFVSFKLGGTAVELGLYPWEALAGDGGVPSHGGGFRGVVLNYLLDSRAKVDETLERAHEAGGRVVRSAAAAQWGGYFGYFSDPDGHLWKVATPA